MFSIKRHKEEWYLIIFIYMHLNNPTKHIKNGLYADFSAFLNWLIDWCKLFIESEFTGIDNLNWFIEMNKMYQL